LMVAERSGLPEMNRSPPIAGNTKAPAQQRIITIRDIPDRDIRIPEFFMEVSRPALLL
jgi:hypothetical protein